MREEKQFVRVILFPVVTTSRDYFAHHIHHFCLDCDIGEEREEKWLKRLEDKIGNYLAGTIFVEQLSPSLLFHELMHHIFAILQGYTQSKLWNRLDYLIDELDVFLFRKTT